MANISRGLKAASGTTNFEDGKGTIFASEVDADLNAIVTEINGNLDNTNIDAAAAIVATKLAGHTAAETSTNPGVSGASGVATSLSNEIEKLRHAIWQMKTGTNTVHNSGSQTATYYGDHPVRGANLVRNSSFEVKTTVSTAAPDGWALVGTPASITQVATPAANGEGMALRIVSAGSAADGISQTFTGLKPSRLYYVSARVSVNTGTVALATSGADVTTNFRDITISTTSSGVQLAGIVSTDASATPIVVQLLANADATADSADWDNIQFREVSPEPTDSPGYIAVRDSSTDTGAVASGSLGAFPSGDALSAAVTVPGPGYTIKVTAALRFDTGASNVTITAQLGETPSTSGTTTYQDVAAQHVQAGSLGSLVLSWVQNAPVVGDTYTYNVQAGASSASVTANGGVLATLQSWLLVELIPPG